MLTARARSWRPVRNEVGNPSGSIFVRGAGWRPISEFMTRRRGTPGAGSYISFRPPKGWLRGGLKKKRKTKISSVARPSRRPAPAKRRSSRGRASQVVRKISRRRVVSNPALGLADIGVMPNIVRLRSRRRVHWNPVATLATTFRDAFSRNSLEGAVQTGIGFAGTLTLSRLVHSQVLPDWNTPVGRIGTTLGSSIAIGSILSMLGQPAFAARALVGGTLALLFRTLTEILPREQTIIPTLGQNDAADDDFRRAVQEEFLRRMRAEGSDAVASERIIPAGAEAVYYPAAVGAYATEQDLRRAMNMGAYLTEKEAARVMGIGSDEFSADGSPERF